MIPTWIIFIPGLIAIVICFILWARASISRTLETNKHLRRARECASEGDWEEASLSYKLAILSGLDSDDKLRELVPELVELYKGNGIDVDLSKVYECPEILRDLSVDTKDLKKQVELGLELHVKIAEFLDSLPGPKLAESTGTHADVP